MLHPALSCYRNSPIVSPKSNTMSSNLIIDKVCIYCGKHFIARTVYTRYCSKACNNRHYKQRKREERVTLFTKGIDSKPIDPLPQHKGRVYLSTKECCVILGISRHTLMRWIEGGMLKASKICRRVIIHKSSLEILIKNNEL